MKCPVCFEEMTPLSQVASTYPLYPTLDGDGNPWLCKNQITHRQVKVSDFSGQYGESYFNGGVYDEYKDFPAHQKRVEKLIRIARPQSVLDVGCAYGYIVKQLLDKGIPAWGCDISEYAEKRAKEIIPGRVKRCPCWELPYEPHSF